MISFLLNLTALTRLKRAAGVILRLVLLLAPALTIAGPPTAAPIDPVVQWNKALLQLVRTPGVQPATLHPTRSFAIMHAAIYDAVNAIHGGYKSYAVDAEPEPGFTSEQAAAVAAAHAVLTQLYPGVQGQLDAQLQESLASIPDGPSKLQGLSLGRMVAERLLALRVNDGANAAPAPYIYGTTPGEYQSPPPASPPQPQFTHWGKVMPFTLPSAAQFRPGPPPALTNRIYTEGFNEIKSVGVTNSTSATPDQSLTGRFWNGAIQNYWNEIAQTAALDQGLSTFQSARLFALLNLTLADSVIAFYEAKYTYRFWRPVTAIRAADSDGNIDTTPDPAWLPEVGRTAPDPSYPGAHGAISAAAAQVLALFFHRDRTDFKVTSESLPGAEKSFPSFSAAAQDASLSRIYAGQHFRFDQAAGEALGRAVAEFVVENFLTPRFRPGAYVQHNLVSDLPGIADAVDPKLVNPWGIGFSSESPFWIADNHSGVSTIYTGDAGAQFSVQIPGAQRESVGAPTGLVFNGTTNFVVGAANPARFIFAGEDGVLTAWESGTNATLVADNSSAGAIYKGLALASTEGKSYLYAPDFHNARVDVFDGQFKPVAWTNAFVDPQIPAGFAPFNIAAVGTNLFVSYARQDEDGEDDVPGAGSGYVDIFDAGGRFLRRFASGHPLNSPWGIVQAPASFGDSGGAILVGNFGDGRINAFDPDTGAFIGALTGTDGGAIRIEGLWGLLFGNGKNGGQSESLYFTAGIAGSGALEDHGLFGRISALPPLLMSINAITDGSLKLDWTGGPGLYLLQSKTNISSAAWTDVMMTTNLGVTIPPDGATRIFRVIKP